MIADEAKRISADQPGSMQRPQVAAEHVPQAEPKVGDSTRKIEIPLPNDRDMDRMMAFLEQAWRRLVEMANRMQKDVTGKI